MMDLERRIEELEKEVEQLRDVVRSTLVGGAVFQAPLSVVDDQGKSVLRVEVNESGPVLYMFDELGKPCMALGSLNEREFCGVYLYRPDGMAPSYLVADAEGGSLMLQSPDGRTHASINAHARHDSSASLALESPGSSVGIQARESGTSSRFAAPSCGREIWLAVQDDDHGLRLTHRTQEGWRHVRLYWDAEGQPRLGLYERDDTPLGTPIDIGT